jgi:photosystem II stability/assembly factor-like uncharacterized protein
MRSLLLLVLLSAFFACNQSNSSRPSDRDEATAISRKHAPADHFFLQRAYPESGIGEIALREAFDQARADQRLRKGPQGFSEPWVLRGPGNIGARINAMAVHPNNSNVIYAGFSSGGLYKTTNGGRTWSPIFDDKPYLAISAITLDPKNTDIVYIGTGDANITGYPFLGDGIYRSMNGGQTWENLGLQETRIVAKILIDPLDSKIIYAATMGLPFERNEDRGLYKSVDGGKTWRQSLFVNKQTGVIDLVMDPSDNKVLYASAWTRIRNNRETIFNGTACGIYKSSDAGQTWERLGGGLPSGTNVGRIGLTTFNGDPKLIFALVVNASSQLDNIYRSSDQGRTWQKLIDWDTSDMPPSVMQGLGWYFGKIAVNPNNFQEIFVLSVSLWRSSDNGRTWRVVDFPNVHADKHAMVFGPSGETFLGTDGGAYRGNTRGEAWEDIENIPTTQFYRIEYNPHQPQRYYGGAQDNGTVFGDGLNTRWQEMFGGDGFQMRFNPSNPNVIWALMQNGYIGVSTNGGSGFRGATQGIDREDRVNWDAPLIISQHNPSTLYTGTQRVYQNTTGEQVNWKPISPDLTDGVIFGRNFHTISVLGESRYTSSYLAAGTSDGNVWLSQNQGQSWNRIDAGLPERYVTAVKFSPNFPNSLYVAHSGYKDNDNRPHLHLSNDLGRTWKSCAGDLPNLAINDLFILPGYEEKYLFVATDAGVYGTRDGGENWYRLGADMPLIAVYSLAWNEARRELVAGTYGKSIFSYPLSTLLGGGTTSLKELNRTDFQLNVFPNPVVENLQVNWKESNTKDHLRLSLYNIFGQKLREEKVSGTQTRWNLQDLIPGQYLLRLGDGMRFEQVWVQKQN